MTDFIDRLERLSALRAAGHITEQEFEAAKAQVLGRAAPAPPPPPEPDTTVRIAPTDTTARIAAPAPPETTVRVAAPDAPPEATARPAPFPAPEQPTLRIPAAPDAPPPRAAFAPPPSSASARTPLLIAGGIVAAVLLVAAMVWLVLPPTRPFGAAPHGAPTAAPTAAAQVDPLPPDPGLPPLATGETLTWSAAQAAGDVERRVGPLAVTIGRTGSGDAVGPLVRVGYGAASVQLEGEHVAAAIEHRVTALANRSGAAPVVMLQSFSGGAHCCNHIRLAGLSGGRLTTIDLGSWDGDMIAPPRDLSGDGVADFVLPDQAFLYAFAPYAMSITVPRVLNVTGGRIVDVSARPAFRHLFTDAMRRSGELCRNGDDGMTRNGACPAYVAAAARTGRLDQAWQDMLASHDAGVDWQLPAGCTIAIAHGECPADRQIQYQSYPEALLAFLKRQGYVARNWQPPAAPVADDGEPDPEPQDSGKN